MRFILTCGGTAGHINPALSVAGRLKQRCPDSEFLFLGAEGNMEMDLVPREGYEIRPLKITNISRDLSLSGTLHNARTLRNVLSSEAVSKRIIQDFAPDAVIGTGGYVCYPVLRAASRMRIPTFIHESNAAPGLTTKLLAGHVDRIFVGFEDSRRFYADPARVVVTGTPVRGDFSRYTKSGAKAELGLPPELPLVVSVWGSLGSGHMNGILTQLLPLLRSGHDFTLIHSIGSRDFADISRKIGALDVRPEDVGVDVREYIYDIPRVMAAADLILCRAGASTLAELVSLGKPAVLIPSPNVTDNHQEKNARILERAGGAEVLLEGEFDAASLLEKVRGLLGDGDRLEKMSAAMSRLSVSDAADRICDEILARLDRT